MVAVGNVFGGMVDDDRLPRVAYLITDSGLNLEFATRRQAEGNLVTHSARNPTLLSHTRHGREAKTGGAANNLKNVWYGLDPGNGFQVEGEVILCEGFFGLHAEILVGVSKLRQRLRVAS
jgi:hypothetical protein